MKLEGIRAVELSGFLPGPYLTQALADHGAQVIKVEPPNGGDPGRQIGLADGPSTVFFRNLNRGKRSVVLNLKESAGLGRRHLASAMRFRDEPAQLNLSEPELGVHEGAQVSWS